MHTAPSHLQARSFRLPLERPLLMGIVNVTPDSFSDGGDSFEPANAIAHARQLVEEGADIIDIGAESSRPGAAALPLEEELRRLLPVLEGCVALGRPVSVDTYKPAVMRAAVDGGAAMLNDIWAFRQEGARRMALEGALGEGVALCMMHMQRDPATMQENPQYNDVVVEVRDFLEEQARHFVDAGVQAAQLVIDPGFGFGKTVAHNLTLLRHLDRLAQTGFTMLAGLSRKSTIGVVTGHREPKARLHGSVAAALLAAQKGAKILRVHDVAATRDAIAVWNAVQQADS